MTVRPGSEGREPMFHRRAPAASGPANFIERCPGCPYSAEKAVGTRGNAASPIVLVGEAPGATEMRVGLPFVGPAGEVLSAALYDAGLDESSLFITNAVACLPPKVRPRVAAIDACHDRLVRDIEAVSPSVIVTLGVTSVRAVMEQHGLLLRDALDRPLTCDGAVVVPTLHPAFVLRAHGRYPRLVADLVRARLLAFPAQRAQFHGGGPAREAPPR